MQSSSTTIGIFADHASAEAAIRKLAGEGFAIKDLSIVGKGYHTDEKVVGFYNMGDRVKFWGSRGALWGGLWGMFFGGMVLTIPVLGHVIVLGYLAATALAAVEGAVVVGGISAISAALYGVGIPKDSVIDYETALAADNFLVMARGSDADMARAKKVLGQAAASRVDTYGATKAAAKPAVPAA
jgi:hypothetical protein